MQAVSATYNPYTSERWSDLRVSFRLVDTDAYSDATATANESSAISQLSQTHDNTEGMGAKWVDLETSGWPLNGSCSIFPDSVTGLQTGWWSGDISGADGSFVTAPTLTFDFTEDHSSIGFTVIFDDKANWYPKEVTVSAYNSSAVLLGTKTVTCTSVKQVIDLPIENYRQVVLTFGDTQEGYQRVRVSEVIFGIVQYFDGDNMTDGSILYELTPMATALPSGELSITIDNSDRKYNMINPDSLYAYLQQSQPLEVELGVGGTSDTIEYINMGRFYYTSSQAEDKAMTAKIIANDRFYQLHKLTCKIGVTGTWTVAEAVAAVISDSGLSITTVIPSAVGSTTINKCIPQNATHREALRLIAQAAMTTCYFNRNDELVFVSLAAGTSVDTLDNDNLYEVAKIKVSDRVNTVELTVKDEYASTEAAYTANNLASGETAQTLSINNPLVAAANGSTVATWLLNMAQMRLTYELKERGNPARELCDTVTVYDAYEENGDAVITKQEYIYDGTLKANTKGVA